MQVAIIEPAQLTSRRLDFVKLTRPAWKIVMSEESTLSTEALDNKTAGDPQGSLAKRHDGVVDTWPREDLGLGPIDPASEK